MKDYRKLDVPEINNNSYVLKEGQIPEYEDKTSDNYVPKSYRTQPKLGILVTKFLDKYLGIRFLQPIKWQNTISIGILHYIFLYYAIGYPWTVVFMYTIIWGELILLLLMRKPSKLKLKGSTRKDITPSFSRFQLELIPCKFMLFISLKQTVKSMPN